MTFEKAKNQALKYLTYRPRTTYELNSYLSKKQYDQQVIDEVIAFLKACSYLDDDTFCQLWIENRSLLKPRGRQGLFFELKNKGVDTYLIEKSLTENFSAEMELDIAKKLISRKILSTNNKFDSHEKIMAYLYRRGFSNSVIHEILNELDLSDSN